MSFFISNAERAAHEAANGANVARRAYPETPSARAEREHREEQERSKQAATARVEAELETQERETRERVEREDGERRTAERAALEEQMRVVFFKSDAATEADWLAVKDELVRAELVSRAQRAFDDDRHAQQANIAGML